MYKNIKLKANSSDRLYPESKGPNDWVGSRYKQLARLRQNALDEARGLGVDYLLVRAVFSIIPKHVCSQILLICFDNLLIC